MKRSLLVVGGLIALIAALALAGFAYAQTQTPPQGNNSFGYGAGMMGNYGRGMMGGFGRGMMGNGSYGYGPMHEYMEEALAKALGITQEDLEAKLAAGETMWTVAQAQGLTDAQISELMTNAHSEALKNAVQAGVITQAQADWMDEHMDQMFSNGVGPGACHGGTQGRRGPGLGTDK